MIPIYPSAMSGSGTKRQFARCKAMSGVGGKADLPVERPDFSVWHETDVADLAGNVRSRRQSGGRISMVEDPSLTHLVIAELHLDRQIAQACRCGHLS
jgi:hypothetical protein